MPRDVSIFDIIGPIMVGPSSSHTAGAQRLGRMARVLLGGPPAEAVVELHGSFAQTGQGHGTHKAIIAGLLDMTADDPRLPQSFTVADETGMVYHFVEADLGDTAHPNTARITVSAGEQRVQMTGASVGGGMIEVTNIQGYDVRFSGEYWTLLILADDRPGTINAVTGWLLKHNINVAFFRVERQQRGGHAIMIIEVDQALPDDLVDAIEDFHWVSWVRTVEKVDS